MKKIFTILCSTVFMASAFAQYGPKEQRDFAFNNDRDKGFRENGYSKDRDDRTNFFDIREMNRQIAMINEKYDDMIIDVKHKFFMGHEKKERQIQWLQDQRRNEINCVIAKFKKFGDRDDDRFKDNDRDRHYDRNW